MNTLGYREHRHRSGPETGHLFGGRAFQESHRHAFETLQRLFQGRGGVEMPIASADRVERYTTSVIENDIG